VQPLQETREREWVQYFAMAALLLEIEVRFLSISY
jgi:hypothetical protein